MRWVLGALPLIVTATLAFSAGAETYENREFGFSVETGGRPICVGEPYEHHHGVDLFLDSGPEGCDHLDDRPFIGINGDYNAAFMSNAEAVANDFCRSRKGSFLDAPDMLPFDNHATKSCRVDRDDGWIDIVVVTQAWEWPGKHIEPEDDLAWVNYTALLHTNAQRFDKDLAIFRSVLNSIHIFKPE